MDRSDTKDSGRDAFLTLRCRSELKTQLEREAEQQGVSRSELARQRLKGEKADGDT